MKLFPSVSLSWTKKNVRGVLSSLALIAILFSGIANASWINDVFGDYEDEVITKDIACFSDLKAGTLETEAACYLKEKGVIGGFPDGEFKGDRLVNRAEAMKFILLGSGKTVTDLKNNNKFPDVLEGEWYVKYVMTAVKYGIIQGYPDGLLRPANSVNTVEFLKIAVETFGLEKGLSYEYADVIEDSWFAKYVGIAEKMQLFPERTTKNLNPAKNLTRKEVAIAIYRILKPINYTLPPEPVSEEINCLVKAGGQIVKKLHADNQKFCYETLNYGNDAYQENNSRNADNCRYSPDTDIEKYEVGFIYKDEIFYQTTCPQLSPLPLPIVFDCNAEINGKIIEKYETMNVDECKKKLDKGSQKENCDFYKNSKYLLSQKLNFSFDGRNFYNEICTNTPAQLKEHILQVSPILNRTMEQEYLTVPFDRVTFLRVGIKNTESTPVYVKNLKFQAHGTEKAQNYNKYKVSLISNLAKPSNGGPTVSVGMSPGYKHLEKPILSDENSYLNINGVVQFNQNNGLYIDGNGYLELNLIVDAETGTAPGKLFFDLVDMDAVSALMTMEMAKERPISILNGQNPLSERNVIRGHSQKLASEISNIN